eukprot:CAMPEP_0172313332 /NCGR_PEP_ID=MMETSP1058-20130122/20056_1 /TAXON_ID=83371 /ORGANISM="Detonula confervacea, Strain CCMP 353" /LENGTH=396 /DNA_ID=CAMNT_0013026973 /DNA_START=399 /DNA_END=1589 /DNA_ORIENTATION=+
MFQTKPTYGPPILVHPWRQHTTSLSRRTFFARHDSKQSEPTKMQQSSVESPPSTGASNSVNSLENEVQRNAHHWFTQLLPEGLCVGVCTAQATASTMSDNEEESTLSSTALLHPDEYQWGQNNIASDTSRTSHYLGRMALRLSLKTLLESERDAISPSNDKSADDAQEEENNSFYTQLHDQIQTTAIMKDYYGRPILPEIILGSISHKGEHAVGLAQFSSSTWNGSNRVFDDGVEAFDASTVQWREECPILEDVDNTDLDDDSMSCSPISSAVRGIGIDLERIDGKRGKRIERKVLTASEQKELGGLKAIGVSSAEEVMLRFSLKESVYKAMHPILCQYVGFQEAEVTPLSNGTAQVTLNLANGAHERLGIVVQSASWKKMGDFFLTSASVGVMQR